MARGFWHAGLRQPVAPAVYSTVTIPRVETTPTADLVRPDLVPADLEAPSHPGRQGAFGSLHDFLFSVVSRSRDMIVIADESGTVVFVSGAIEEVAGWTAADLLGTDGLHLIHPDDLPSFGEHLNRLFEHPDEPSTTQARIRRTDGDWVWTEVVALNLLSDPDVRGLVGHFRDITDRKHAELALRESEERFRWLVQSGFDLLAIVDREGNTTYLSPSHERILGHPLSLWLSGHGRDIIHPADVEELGAALQDVSATPGKWARVRCRMRHANGSWRWFENVFTNMLDVPAVKGVVSNSRDTTDAEAAADALRRSSERFRALVRHSSDVIIVLDERARPSYISPATEHVLGHKPADLLGGSLLSFVHPEDRPMCQAHFDTVGADPTREHTIELRGRHADGRWRWFELRTTNLLYEPAVQGVVCHIRDVTDRRSVEQALEYRALHDPLTSLPNRALVVDRLTQTFASARRHNLSTAVLFVDLDRFKSVNDSLGHAAGDELLVEVARRLGDGRRAVDTVARLGGDEFVIVLHDLTDADSAVDIARTIMEELRRPFVVHGRELIVTASIGLSITAGADEVDAETVLHEADAAMYDAKSKGGDRVSMFDKEVWTRTVRRIETEQALRRAIANDELFLEYQPVYDLSGDPAARSRMVGVEALIRWRHPEQGLISPVEFIPVAEATELIVPIGEWVLDAVCAQVGEWRALDPSGAFRTAWVNVSGRQLARPQFPRVVAAAIDRYGLEPTALGLELTESTLIDEAEAPGTELRDIEALGVRVAIDDFGTGYSSLLYLLRFRVDILKIDRTFVAGLGTSDESTAIVEAVIGLAHTLGMTVSAEGVETTRQLDELRRLSCDTACGFLLSRPVGATEISALLRSGSEAGKGAKGPALWNP